MTTADFYGETAVQPPSDVLRDELIDMIRKRDHATPRHRQRELGPSEVGHPCMRKMAFGMMEVPRCNPQYDPLPSIIGVATHKWLESAASYANNELGRQRWLAETRVNVAPGLAGSCDLYDRDTETLIDWKVPGDNRFKMYVKEMSPAFRGQVHLYGFGFENASLPVKQVVIALLPRGGTLTRMHIWREDYNRQFALSVLARREAVITMINDFRVEIDPGRYQWIPIQPYDCAFCPWFSPNPRSPLQCGGKT